MPIKMTGSVRPTSLTSPDPISMPIINKLPALKAKVIDIRDNGPGVPAPAVSPYAPGLFIATDWQTNGDTKATLDTNTGLEWLDLSETDNQSYNSVLARLSTDLVGWRMPTRNEITVLMESAFPGVVYTHQGTYVTIAGAEGIARRDNFITHFGYTDAGVASYGFFDKNGVCSLAGVDNYSYAYDGYEEGYNFALPHTQFGVFLVSDGGTTLSSLANPAINTPAV